MPVVKHPKTGQLVGVIAPYGIDADGKLHKPHPTQQFAFQWAKDIVSGKRKSKGGGIPVLYIQHGVNSGGTRAALTPIIDYFMANPGVSVLIGRKDYNDVKRSVMRDWFEILEDAGARPVEKDGQLHEYTYKVNDGKSKVFFTDLKDAGGLGSQQYPAILVCEAYEIEYEVYQALKRRCRKAGLPSFMIMEGNPPRENHWLSLLTQPDSQFYDPDVERVMLTSEENYAFMSAEYKHMLETMNPAWRRRFVLAEAAPLPSGTPVYSSFVQDFHVRKTWLIPDRPLIRGWDFGFRYPACIWTQQSIDGRLSIQHEWMPFETPEDKFIDGVIQRTNEWYGDRTVIDYGDPAATQRDPQGISTLKRLSDRGIMLKFRQTTYEDRIPLINQRFNNSPGGQPSVIVDPQCTILVEALAGGYHYQEIKEGQVWTTKQELPYKDGYYEHLSNAMEYLMVNLYGGSSNKVITRMIQSKRFKFRQAQMQRRTSLAAY